MAYSDQGFRAGDRSEKDALEMAGRPMRRRPISRASDAARVAAFEKLWEAHVPMGKIPHLAHVPFRSRLLEAAGNGTSKVSSVTLVGVTLEASLEDRYSPEYRVIVDGITTVFGGVFEVCFNVFRMEIMRKMLA